MPAIDAHTSLAIVWPGPRPVRSALPVSSLGHPDSDRLDMAATAITPIGQGSSRLRAPFSELSVPGRQLGRYRLIERLGCGCQGDVWKAVATEPGAVAVALKLLPRSLARDPRRQAQFRREAERRARLAVPSVLPTTEFGEADGFLFMAMPLVEGCTLNDILICRRGDSLADRPGPQHPLACAPAAEYLRGVVGVVARVARTLEQVHAARVVHRDVKPANILLDRRHEEGVFLCDFGLSRDLDVATPEQLRDGAGTPLYMPPERLLRQLADEVLCDIYALGATLYEAVTLVPPVQVPESLPWPAWTSYLASTTPALPRSIRPGLPLALEAIILRAMAPDPQHRYPSASRLAEDLEWYLARGPSCGGPASGRAGPRADLPTANRGPRRLSATGRPDPATTPAARI